MCIVPDKLKRCTCTEDKEEFIHYRELHRLVKGKDVIIMGELVPPAETGTKTNQLNKQMLLQLGNVGMLLMNHSFL